MFIWTCFLDRFTLGWVRNSNCVFASYILGVCHRYFCCKCIAVCSVPSKYVSMCCLFNTVRFFAWGNKYICFCVLSAILMKIQIVTYIYRTLQLLDSFSMLDEKSELNTNLRNSFGKWVQMLIAVTMWRFFMHIVFSFCSRHCRMCPLKCQSWVNYRHRSHNF